MLQERLHALEPGSKSDTLVSMMCQEHPQLPGGHADLAHHAAGGLQCCRIPCHLLWAGIARHRLACIPSTTTLLHLSNTLLPPGMQYACTSSHAWGDKGFVHACADLCDLLRFMCLPDALPPGVCASMHCFRSLAAAPVTAGAAPAAAAALLPGGSGISVQLGSISHGSMVLCGALDLVARMLREQPAACGAAISPDCAHAIADLAGHGGFSVRQIHTPRTLIADFLHGPVTLHPGWCHVLQM